MILISVILSSLFILQRLGYVAGQIFERDCNAQIIVDHIVRYGHTYCSHACGEANGICAADGSCNCPCSAAGPDAMFAPDICPPKASDLPDPNPAALPACMASCASKCIGGTGQICGEVQVLQQGGQNLYAKICTCICPSSTCGQTTTTTTTMAPTTTTMAPMNATVVVPVAVAVIKPLLLKKIAYLIKKGLLYNLVIFGTVLKLLILGLSALPLILFVGFVFNSIASMIENWMFSSLYGMMRVAEHVGSYM